VSAIRKTAHGLGGAVSSDTVIDLIQRLGLLDLAVDKVRARLEQADIDDILDDVTDYLRRNPEVVVVLLGTITVAAGMIVYLERADRWRKLEEDEEEEEKPRPRRRAS
jgi:excinuclease UvrABC helicase subunit UvrB